MSKSTLYQFGIAVVALLLFLPTSQIHLFDWDEINFAEAAREMIVTGDYLTVTIDYQPFWEKPPLFIWLQVLSMKAFGITEFAARLPNVICGIATLLALFNIGKRIYNIEFAKIWVLAYLGTLLPQFYFMSGIIDPVYNLFIFLALYNLHQYVQGEKANALVYAAILTGLAVLTKGPVAVLLLVAIIMIYSLANGSLRNTLGILASRMGWLSLLVFLLVCSFYYGAEFIRNGPTFFTEFIDYHLRLLQTSEASHGQPFYYHFFVLLIGCLPTSILMFGGFKNMGQDGAQEIDFTRLMIVMFCVVLFVFSVVETKIIHYSSLCYFPLTFLASRYVYNVAYRKMKPVMSISLVMLCLSGLLALLLLLLPYIMSNVEAIIPLVQDPFAVASLRADVPWTWVDGLGGLVYFMSLVVFVYLVSKRRLAIAYVTLLIGMTLSLNITFRSVVPKVELITQHAAVEFYKSLQGVDCYVEVLGFKSYAHYFYARKPRPSGDDLKTKEELLEGLLTKPAYFAVRNVDAEQYRTHPNLEELYVRNGYVFFKRMPGL
jgi:4-amino-4-deoxy-L-arabinose transferase-like glycosyltransferase